ncbi:sensor histidine kinase [Actinoplanes couchii]|uniref:histidine kinase n=1 Tax=Actinoplanes couchii TaxID=403638 RepID=A0ABQ3XP90_9ACTN|nr:histidine kinase [Actinoplanes couchii]MDR6318682.1 signal transduction histidine kinase [Actinoplanes couchii]GID60290.1 hypothetical protein Aco03nite_086940 [Actinoplanes couchii]
MGRGRGRQVIVDVVLAVVAATAGITLELTGPVAGKHLTAPVWIYVAAQLAAASLLLIRRRAPYRMGLAIAAISVLVPAWAAVLAPFAITAYGSGRRWRQWAVIATLTTLFLVGAQAWAIQDPVTAPVVFLCSALLGMYARARRSLLVSIADRARADERSRLAGEMHDVVTHRINLMVLQAGALRVSSTDPQVRAAAEQLRVAGCEALAELRDLVGMLRGGDRGTAGPAEATLASLIEQSRAVGLPVRLDEQGDPQPVAPAVLRTVFRVVQESLTNVHKHAPGAETTVAVRYGGQRVSLDISNTRPPHWPDLLVTAAGGGSGLDGLRHRIEVLGGTLSAGNEPGGGFAVRVTLPAYVPTAVSR